VLKIYSDITEKQLAKYINNLEEFIKLLVHTKYYDQREPSTAHSKAILGVISSKETFAQEMANITSIKEIKGSVPKGIKQESFLNKIMNKNIIFLVPVIMVIFFFIFYQRASNFNIDSSTVL
jgi:hypothetical protein